MVKLAYEAAVAPSTIYSIEREEKSPQIATCYRIAAALDRPIDDLFPEVP